MPDGETSAAGYFGAELKAHRASQEWTQVQLADRIGYSGSFVSDVERGARLASLDFAQRCDRQFELPGTFARLHDIARRDAYPSFFAPVIGYESSAVKISAWELGSVPGLLQTERYARALVQATRPYDSPEAVERLVHGRMERQQILTRRNPPRAYCALDESVLRRIVGNSEIMTEQIDRLIECARHPAVVLQVLPFTAGDHAGTDGPVTMYEFSDRSTVCYAECNRGGRIVEDPAEVAELATVLEMIRSNALSPRATLDLLATLRREIDELHIP